MSTPLVVYVLDDEYNYKDGVVAPREVANRYRGYIDFIPLYSIKDALSQLGKQPSQLLEGQVIKIPDIILCDVDMGKDSELWDKDRNFTGQHVAMIGGLAVGIGFLLLQAEQTRVVLIYTGKDRETLLAEASYSLLTTIVEKVSPGFDVVPEKDLEKVLLQGIKKWREELKAGIEKGSVSADTVSISDILSKSDALLKCGKSPDFVLDSIQDEDFRFSDSGVLRRVCLKSMFADLVMGEKAKALAEIESELRSFAKVCWQVKWWYSDHHIKEGSRIIEDLQKFASGNRSRFEETGVSAYFDDKLIKNTLANLPTDLDSFSKQLRNIFDENPAYCDRIYSKYSQLINGGESVDLKTILVKLLFRADLISLFGLPELGPSEDKVPKAFYIYGNGKELLRTFSGLNAALENKVKWGYKIEPLENSKEHYKIELVIWNEKLSFTRESLLTGGGNPGDVLNTLSKTENEIWGFYRHSEKVLLGNGKEFVNTQTRGEVPPEDIPSFAKNIAGMGVHILFIGIIRYRRTQRIDDDEIEY